MKNMLNDIFKSFSNVLASRLYSAIVFNVLIYFSEDAKVGSLVFILLAQEFLVSYYSTELRNSYLKFGFIDINILNHSIFIVLSFVTIMKVLSFSLIDFLIVTATWLFSLLNILKAVALEKFNVSSWIAKESIINVAAVTLIASTMFIYDMVFYESIDIVYYRYFIFSLILLFFLRDNSFISEIKFKFKFSIIEFVGFAYILTVLAFKVQFFDVMMIEDSAGDVKLTLIIYNFLTLLSSVVIRVVYVRKGHDFEFISLVVLLLSIIFIFIGAAIESSSVNYSISFLVLAIWFNLVSKANIIFSAILLLINLSLLLLWISLEDWEVSSFNLVLLGFYFFAILIRYFFNKISFWKISI